VWFRQNTAPISMRHEGFAAAETSLRLFGGKFGRRGSADPTMITPDSGAQAAKTRRAQGTQPAPHRLGCNVLAA